MADLTEVGQRIKRHRDELGWSLSRLAHEATVSKGYLWSLEKGDTKARPSGETLYRIADALGVTMSDLLGRQLLVAPAMEPSAELLAFAEREHLPETDVQMLASINFRGKRPASEKDWEFIYRAIRASVEP
jgi:transcriptional regulator with XRE-family HTH domain